MILDIFLFLCFFYVNFCTFYSISMYFKGLKMS